MRYYDYFEITGFPRPRGDEPVHDMQHDVDDEFSPPTRG